MLFMAIRGAAAFSLLVAASLGVSAQQSAPASPNQGQMPMEHGKGGMTPGQGMNQSQGQNQGGKGGMMNDMSKMHQGSGTPPSSAHTPPQGGLAPVPTQCPAGTTLRMDDGGQHLCK